MITKFYYEHGLIIISAKISGSKKTDFPVLLALDTGSYFTNLRPDILDKVGAAFTSQKALLLGVGETVEGQFAYIESLSVLGITNSHMLVTSNPLPKKYSIDGLLGNEFLLKHKICIDFPNGTISIE